jgi:hypothetical protein
MTEPENPGAPVVETTIMSDLAVLKEAMIAQAQFVEARVTLNNRITNLERLLKFVGGCIGLTVISLVGGAFMLGGKLAAVESGIQTSSERVNKVYQVVWEDKDSLAARAERMQNKIDPLEGKMKTIDAKIDELLIRKYGTGVRAVGTPEPAPSPE